MTNSIEIRSPWDEALIDTIPLHNEAEVMALVERGHARFAARDSWLPPGQRAEILTRMADLLEGRLEEFAQQSAREGGKPIKDSRVELTRALRGVRVAVRELHHMGGREVPMRLTDRSLNRYAVTYREPRGLAVAISAFNHPFNLIVHQVIPAVAVGAPVVVKPAKATPFGCRNVLSLLKEAGLPEGWAEMFVCDNQVTTKVVADPRTAFLSFIGSSRVGWMLRAKLAPGAVAELEHGGSAPVVIDATADLDKAVAPLVRAGFYHAGQVCVKAQRLYVHASKWAKFTDAFVTQTQALVVGDPNDDKTDVGPLISRAEVDRVEEWVQEAVDAGAELLCGGQRLGPTTYAPTVLANVPDGVRLTQDEVFGPVTLLQRFDALDDAVRRANALPFYFQAAVFTQDVDVALGLSRKLNGTAVMVNDHPAFRVDWMPFGGHRDSGLGMGGIGDTMRDMTLERMVVFKSDQL